MKIYILILMGILLISNAIAVSNVAFNYEFNNSKVIIYSNIVKDDSIVLNVQTDINSLYCKYNEIPGYAFDSMTGTFDFSFQQLHKKAFSYLNEGVYKVYVKCKNDTTLGQESELVFSIINPVKAEIYLSKDSPVSIGLIEITLKTTKQLSQKPTLSYSTGLDRYELIPLTGSNDIWKGYILISSDLKESIGSFKFRGIDLDGIVGEEIIKGEIFLIDTINPPTINEIDAESRNKDIYLEWRFNEDYSHFNIYRSKFPNVEYTDYYKQVDKKSFTDDDVEVGRSYYYRITAIDDAGNEGELSYEVSSIAIMESDNSGQSDSQSGLDPELIGDVDSFLYDLNEFYESIEQIKSEFATNTEDEIVDILKLNSEVDSSKKEIENLENEVSTLKTQKLTRVELDKKLANAKTKLGIIKKKTPESISISSKTEYNANFDESKINEVLLSMGKNEDEIGSLIKKSTKVMTDKDFKYQVKIRNILIYYADGSKFNKAIFIKDISFNGQNNGSIIESIPKDIAQSVSEISFMDNTYNVIKDDSIVSFNSEVDSIVYVINKEVSLESARLAQTFFLIDDKPTSSNSITGFAILENGLNSNFFIVILILLIAGFLIYYFIKSKKDKNDLENLDIIGDKLVESRLYLETKNMAKLDEIYNEINECYKKLNDQNKKAVYNKLINFNKQIKYIKLRK